MLSPEERAFLTDKQDQLIELLVLQDEAKMAEDWDRVRALQDEISSMHAQTEAIRQRA